MNTKQKMEYLQELNGSSDIKGISITELNKITEKYRAKGYTYFFIKTEAGYYAGDDNLALWGSK